MKKVKDWIFQRWMRLEYSRRYKIKTAFWWVFSIIGILNVATVILYFDDPDYAPYIAFGFTIYAYFTYTRQRSTQDAYAQNAEHWLSEIHAQNFYYRFLELKKDIGTERYEREKSVHILSKEIETISSRLPERNSWSEHKRSPRRSNIAPMRPAILNQPVMHVTDYKDVCKEYKRDIKEYRAHSNRLATMEGIAITYGAALSAFGGELIKIVNG